MTITPLTPALDVNAAFATEKTDQLTRQRAARDAALKGIADHQAWLDGEVAAGRMRQTSPTTYEVTQGWDAGEVFRTRRLPSGLLQVEPQHGLDTTTGDAALFTRVPAWHGLGNVARGDETIDEILDLGGIAYGVDKRLVRYQFDGDLHEADGQFVTVREDTGAALGVVGSRYEVLQNRDLFTFLEDLVATDQVVWESAGALRGGRRVFVSMRIPEPVIIDRGGIDDEILLFLAAMNSHDGTSQAETVLTPWRPVCGNTERFALRDARARWGIRHTSGALSRLEEARRTLGLTVNYAEEFAAEETTLARTTLAIDQFHDLINALWEPADDDAPVRTRNNDTRRRDTLDAMWRAESERVGRTAFAAERAITDYLDHVAPRRPGRTMTEEIARATALMEGSDDALKTKAHKRLMTLTRR